jgi:hypothetical protein
MFKKTMVIALAGLLIGSGLVRAQNNGALLDLFVRKNLINDQEAEEVRADTEQFALNPNLVDSDLFDSRVNLEGFFLQANYAVSAAVTTNLTYAQAWQIDHGLGTGGVGDIGINPVDRFRPI